MGFLRFMVLSFHIGYHESMDPFAKGSSNLSLDCPLNLSTAFSILLTASINLFYYLVACTWAIFLMVVNFIFSRISRRCFPSIDRVLCILSVYFPLEREEAEIRSYNLMRKFLSLYSYIHLVLPNALKVRCLRAMWYFSQRKKHKVVVFKLNWWKCCILVSDTFMLWSQGGKRRLWG